MFEELSEKQVEILNYMKKEIMAKGYPPAVREICQAVGLKSTATVHSHLKKLEEKGFIRKDPTKPRAIEILDRENEELVDVPKHETINIPVVGKVTAGMPILAVENIEDTFPVPVEFVGNDITFMLSVTGDSMVNAGILDGDYILVKQQNTANNGDIVVALIDDEATVKRFYKETDHFRLQPENDAMSPIIVDHVMILGKVRGVFRRM